jgi:hypothetical protein
MITGFGAGCGFGVGYGFGGERYTAIFQWGEMLVSQHRHHGKMVVITGGPIGFGGLGAGGGCGVGFGLGWGYGAAW